MFHRPWVLGKFLISAGLRPLNQAPIFLTSNRAEKYLVNKQQALTESWLKYYPPPIGLDPPEYQLIAQFLEHQIQKDLPEIIIAKNHLPQFHDPIDHLLSYVTEDFAVWKMQQGKEWLALIHLCAPNHWAAQDKIGQSFSASHLPVPHIEQLSQAAVKFFEQVQRRGPVERFAWGVATDDRLNHHPDPPPGMDSDSWKGRAFNPAQPELFIRLERQTLFAINPEMLGFTIHTSFHQVANLPKEEKRGLHQAIAAMDEKVLSYKGLKISRDDILRWLDANFSTQKS